MTRPRFDRRDIRFRSVRDRTSRLSIETIAFDPDTPPPDPGPLAAEIDRVAEAIREAHRAGAPVVLAHGAHLIKNGLGPLVARMVEDGWIDHVATNGAGSIHDWEFAFLGRSTEDVRHYVERGEFGLWEETGAGIGTALLVGALDGLGYGEAVGRLICEQRVDVPSKEALAGILAEGRQGGGGGWADRAAAAADLLDAIETSGLESGAREMPHSHADWSLQAACWRTGVPFTVHPGIGYDIIYGHPLVRGGAVGRTSMRDFLRFAGAIRDLEGGVYLSVGSAVMSPMIFEKALSMARNPGAAGGRPPRRFLIAVNDLADADWDWTTGEPPPEHPAYYVRFCKSFSRMGGTLRYLGLDNRAFLGGLYQRLRSASPA